MRHLRLSCRRRRRVAQVYAPTVRADASILAPVGYLSIVFSIAAGYIYLGEIPELRVLVGVAIILFSLQGAAWLDRRQAGKAICYPCPKSTCYKPKSHCAKIKRPGRNSEIGLIRAPRESTFEALNAVLEDKPGAILSVPLICRFVRTAAFEHLLPRRILRLCRAFVIDE
ncbi:hypothetical protein J2Z84_004876 [Agrobacterium rubi]|nr:hypothetical protein [Agrobacterium rubi]